MPNFRRGVAAMNQAQESSNKGGGGQFTFVPNIGWKNDREEKYIAFLNPAEEIPTVDLHEWIPVGTRENGSEIFEWFLSRRDAAIGESYDDIEDRLGRKARVRSIGVAVELEPTFSMVNGRKRPTGFQVKTETFDRKVEGGGTEEVVAPVIGFVIQSPLNFYGWVGTFSESEAPIEETPLKVVRRGKDQNTAYDFTPYLDQPVDYTNLIEHIENVRYFADLVEQVQGEDAKEVALSLGALALDKRLDELADKERYDTLVAPITEIPDKFGKNQPRQNAPRNGSAPEPVSAAPVGEGKGLAKLRKAVAERQPA
jgi:hypothetical protein